MATAQHPLWDFQGCGGLLIWMGKNTNNLNIHYPGIASYVENMHDNGVIDATLEQGGFKMRIPMHHLSMSESRKRLKHAIIWCSAQKQKLHRYSLVNQENVSQYMIA